eukprot:CAMPEP_0114532328 /NCGR_PEP_ID=MMETSP0109-20121206/26604_1 /TAXON_ID=29199 /ORGANISM="Chlorarachnion reptans, Strain CCCM449" /LENGTH=78 /DNA_ID=CAMNT_0001715379 /DNA_START=821 /DNA_END=1054 /DNA_ORIENTATION=-
MDDKTDGIVEELSPNNTMKGRETHTNTFSGDSQHPGRPRSEYEPSFLSWLGISRWVVDGAGGRGREWWTGGGSITEDV